MRKNGFLQPGCNRRNRPVLIIAGPPTTCRRRAAALLQPWFRWIAFAPDGLGGRMARMDRRPIHLEQLRRLTVCYIPDGAPIPSPARLLRYEGFVVLPSADLLTKRPPTGKNMR